LSSGQIANTSAGIIALTGDSSENISFSRCPKLMLGATSNSNYTGSLTPAGATYHLGGGGANLTISGTNALSGANSVVIGANGSTGTVTLASSTSYTGGTTLVTGLFRAKSFAVRSACDNGNQIFPVAAGFESFVGDADLPALVLLEQV
jgi:hypothetical protein